MFQVIAAAISSVLAPLLARLVSGQGLLAIATLLFHTLFLPFLAKIQQMALVKLGAIPAEFAPYIAVTGIFDATSVIFAAYFTAIALKMLGLTKFGLFSSRIFSVDKLKAMVKK